MIDKEKAREKFIKEYPQRYSLRRSRWEWFLFNRKTRVEKKNEKRLAREKRILELRKKGISFQKIGKEFGLTYQRIQQIYLHTKIKGD